MFSLFLKVNCNAHKWYKMITHMEYHLNASNYVPHKSQQKVALIESMQLYVLILLCTFSKSISAFELRQTIQITTWKATKGLTETVYSSSIDILFSTCRENTTTEKKAA